MKTIRLFISLILFLSITLVRVDGYEEIKVTYLIPEGSGEIAGENIQHPNGLEAMVVNAPNTLMPRSCSYYCSAYSNLGVIHSPPIGDPEFGSGTERIVRLFRQMIDTGKPPIPYEHILEPIAIIEAARIAQHEGRRVLLREVYDATAREVNR